MQFTETRPEAIILLRDAIDIISPDDPTVEKLRQELYWLLDSLINPDSFSSFVTKVSKDPEES